MVLFETQDIITGKKHFWCINQKKLCQKERNTTQCESTSTAFEMIHSYPIQINYRGQS